jgi:predicted DNA-binding protein with PD1-like motif
MTFRPSFDPHPLRLPPGADLRQALQAHCTAQRWQAVFVLAGIGSLRPVSLRLAGTDTATVFDDDAELLTLSGTVGASGLHLHASVALSDGRVLGGHVSPGCTVRTTAELLLAVLPAHRFDREIDAATGYAELVVRPRSDERPA